MSSVYFILINFYRKTKRKTIYANASVEMHSVNGYRVNDRGNSLRKDSLASVEACVI